MMAEALPNFWQRLLHTRMRDVVRGQIDGSLDWRVTVARVELPHPIVETVSQVVRRTRLLPSEKVAVAEELISHFQEGLDTGRSADELITTFGDVHLAARLIRRSKRRCRSLAWHVAHWISCALSAVFVLYLLAAVWCLFDSPRVTTDYIAMLNERNGSLAESDRAWPLYMAAFSALVAEHDPIEAVPHGVTNPVSQALPEFFSEYRELSASEREVADAWLVKNAQYLELLRAAAAKPALGLDAGVAGDYSAEFRALFELDESAGLEAYADPMEKRMVIGIMLPHVQAMREAAAALAADMQRASAAGDGETALADFRAMLGIAAHCYDSPLLVSAVVGRTTLQRATRSLETAILEHADVWSHSQLQNAAHLLAAHRLDLVGAMRDERLAFLDLVQRLYSDDGQGDGRLTAKGIRWIEKLMHVLGPSPQDEGSFSGLQQPVGRGLLALGMPAVNIFVASRAEIVAKNDALWRAAERNAARPLWEPADSESMELLIHQLERDRFRYAPLALMFPAVHVARNTLERAQGFRDGALIGLALELYHRENDRWPESLEELAPRYLPTLPVDRIHGGPLAYQIVGDRPLVYSLGVDGDDDGGVLAAECRGDPTHCRVGPPSERPDDAADGDWVLWGTPTERELVTVTPDQQP